MKEKLYLGVLRDLIQPGISDINRRNAKNYKLVIDFLERKLVISDGTVLVDDDQCEFYEDQRAMVEANFGKWKEGK